MPNHPPQIPRRDAARPLRLAPEHKQPDDRVPVALALLGPIEPILDDQATNALCADGISTKAADDLLTDPRYVIGRLHQALTALLSADVPPMDATAILLGEALRDAIAYRQQTCARCAPHGICAACWPHWRKADEYEALHGQLGIIASLTARPALSIVRPDTR
jgi:hypothetical protein